MSIFYFILSHKNQSYKISSPTLLHKHCQKIVKPVKKFWRKGWMHYNNVLFSGGITEIHGNFMNYKICLYPQYQINFYDPSQFKSIVLVFWEPMTKNSYTSTVIQWVTVSFYMLLFVDVGCDYAFVNFSSNKSCWNLNCFRDKQVAYLLSLIQGIICLHSNLQRNRFTK